MQHIEQRRAVDGDGMHIGAEGMIAHVEHHPAALRVGADQPLDSRAERRNFGVKAKCRQHGKAGGLQHQARTERARRLEALEQADAMAGAAQQQRRSQSARASARDRNIK